MQWAPVISSRFNNMETNRERQWLVRASKESHDCINPVRSCEELYYADVLELSKKNGKELIRLSIGKGPQLHDEQSVIGEHTYWYVSTSCVR